MPDLDGNDREASFVAADPNRAPAPSRWAELIAKINALTEKPGTYVTQVHTRDNRSGIYETENGSAAIHGNGNDDFLVTSDGKRHEL